MIERQLAEVYISEWFGPIVGKVVRLLATRGPLTIAFLLQMSKGTLTSRQVKDSLFVLLQHSFAYWKFSSVSNTPEYHLNIDRIHFFIGGFGWINKLVKRLYPENIDIFTEVTVMGMVPSSNATVKLVEAGILELVVSLEIESKSVDEDRISHNKKQRSDSIKFVRASMLGLMSVWKSELLYEFVSCLLNESAGKIARHLYFSSSTASSVAMQFGKELKVDFSKSRTDGRSTAFHYLETLVQRFSFVKRTSSMGTDRQSTVTYSIDRSLMIKEIQDEVFLTTLCRRFGRPSARVMRYLIVKGPQEDKVLSEELLMTAKEVRERCFQLLSVGLIHLQEIPRTIDHAPSRTIFLWSPRNDITFKHLLSRQHAALKSCILAADKELNPDSRDQMQFKRHSIFLDSVAFHLFK